MKTTEEIRQMFLENVKKFDRRVMLKNQMEEIAKAEAERLASNEPVKPKVYRDRTQTVNVTDICVYTTMCPRNTYYNKVVNRPMKPETLLRLNIGNSIHEIPINENGNEISFEYEGFRCRMDDLDFEDGWIADKKTIWMTAWKAKEYPEKQLNMYRVIAEDNLEKPFKVNQLFVLNVNVKDGAVQCLDVPMWDKQLAKDFMMSARAEIQRVVRERELPSPKKGWWCDGCPYAEDLCPDNLPMDPSAIDAHMVSDEPEETIEP